MTIELANHLAELRKEKGYSQEELALKLNVSRQAISKWECGEASPDTDNLLALASLYDVSLDELVKAKNADKEDSFKKKPLKYGLVVLLSLLGLALLAFVLIGFASIDDSSWSWAWTLILDAIWIFSLFEAVSNKNPAEFSYPIFVTSLYLKVGFLCENPNWGNFWYVFLTIPLYYAIIGTIHKKAHKK